jgi:hypothetical protein
MGTPRKTHCRNGHEFTEENTRHSKSGRKCRACAAERSAKRYAEQKDLPRYKKQEEDPYIPMHRRSLEEKLADPEYGPRLRMLMAERAASKARQEAREGAMPKIPQRTYTRLAGIWVGQKPILSRPEAP